MRYFQTNQTASFLMWAAQMADPTDLSLSSTFAFDALVAYGPRDQKIARDLAQRLQTDGLSVWYDEWGVREYCATQRNDYLKEFHTLFGIEYPTKVGWPLNRENQKLLQSLDAYEQNQVRRLGIVWKVLESNYKKPNADSNLTSKWLRATFLAREIMELSASEPPNATRRNEAFEQAITASRTLVFLMSNTAFGDSWPLLEHYTLFFRDVTHPIRRFIPVIVDESDTVPVLSSFCAIKWFKPSESEYRKLRAAIRNAREATPAIADRSLSSLHQANDDEVLFTRIPPTVDGSSYTCTISQDGSTIAIAGRTLVSVRHVSTWNYVAGVDWDPVADGTLKNIALSSDGTHLALASTDCVSVVSLASSEVRQDFRGITQRITAVGFSRSDNRFIGLEDGGVLFISANGDSAHRVLGAHSHSVSHVLSASARDIVVTVAADGTIRQWTSNGEAIDSEFSTGLHIRAAGISANGQYVVCVSSKDSVISLWDLPNASCKGVFEGHLGDVLSVCVAGDEFVVSGSSDQTVRVWRLLTGECLRVLRGGPGKPFQVVVTPKCDNIFALLSDWTAGMWTLRMTGEETTVVARYTSAKVVLAGDSGVGKSGLAIRLTNDSFVPTLSSDAHWATQLCLPQVSDNALIDREIWLWDFAGQSGYRLIHQLFMDETALAILLFNPQANNPFDGLLTWDRDLRRAGRRKFNKLLVAGRIDRGGLLVSRDDIEQFATQHGFAQYLETSALRKDGIEDLRMAISRYIDWNDLPWTASPRLFKVLKNEILKLRSEGVVLLNLAELKQQMEMRLASTDHATTQPNDTNFKSEAEQDSDLRFTQSELRTVVRLLAVPGIVMPLEFGDVILLRPEWINRYASAAIRSIHKEIGVLNEADVLAGDLDYTLDIMPDLDRSPHDSQLMRLPPYDEAIVLRAMHQMFVDHGLCVRDDVDGRKQLIFPSYFRRELPQDLSHPPTIVSYRFSGNPADLYATLVVQLYQTKAFEHDRMWRYAADFKSQTGGRIGLKLTEYSAETSMIDVYSDLAVADDTKVTFIKYVDAHLKARAEDVIRLRHYVCPNCHYPVKDLTLTVAILQEFGENAEIRCQQRRCDKLFPLWDVIEEKFADKETISRVQDLKRLARDSIDNESRELILIGHVFCIVAEAGHIFRTYSNSDHGLDGEIEFKGWNGKASGKRLYLQLKSGDSYLRRRKHDDSEVFSVKKEQWAECWVSQKYPVMLVIRGSNNIIRWMNVSEYLEKKRSLGEWPPKEIVFSGEEFTVVSVERKRMESVPRPGPR